jgi:hypothetical protein
MTSLMNHTEVVDVKKPRCRSTKIDSDSVQIVAMKKREKCQAIAIVFVAFSHADTVCGWK